ncbi:MAG: hypothetical protein LUG85_01375 [Clostridiales bacterium]|nr:hypothetical protein [Clostridiales bacterium]MCD7827176.1 hypothetical protein [Clostridiales bacterium]
MFSDTSDAVERGLDWLERIIDLIVRLFEALFGGSNSTTTTAAAETTTVAESE